MASKLGTLTLDLICRTGNFTQGMRDASNSANRELGRIEQSTNGATNAIKGMAVAALGAFSIHQVIAYTDSYTNLQNRLKLVTNSQQELNTATKDTFAIAQATAQSWGSVAQVYQRFAENSSRLGITMQQTASLTDTVSKAISISGASASSAEAALMQFGQALASGVLRGEEFNSIAEQAPALLKAIATGLGVNIGELRKMAGEGQLTGDVVIKALTKAKTSVDDLFSKTDFTIAQSFTQLNDSVTKFVGEAGTGSGAAKTLASSIKLVADNVDTIANVATLGGVAFLTKAVISQTIAMRESIAASIQRRLADTAALESQVRLSMIEVQRTKAKVGELAAEQNLIVAKLRTNITTQERIVLETRATQVAIQLAVAERNMTAATAQRTLAQNSLNASTAIGSRVLGLVGGPIGALTLGVTALAAGYMYMESQAAKANQKLSEQADVANKTKQELLALEGAQKKGAIVDLNTAFDSQNKSLYALTFQFKTYMRMIEDANRGNIEVARISDLVHAGKISEIDALSRLNKMNVITPEQFKQGDSYINSLEKTRNEAHNSANALKVFGINVELMGNKSSNAALKVKEISKEAITTSEKVKALDGAIQKFISNSLSSSLQNQERLKLYNNGLSKEAADLLLNARDAAGITGTNQQLPLGALVLLGRELITTNQIKKVEDERNKSEKERTKEFEKQYELQKMVGASALSGLRIKSSESVAGGKVRGYTAEFAQLTQDALGDKLGRFTSFNDAYHKGTNSKHATGNAFDFTTKSAKDAELAIARLNTLAKQYGFTIKTLNEYSNPSSRATGGHVHVSVLGYKGGEEALKDAKAKLKIDQDYNADRKKEADEIDQFLQQYSNADVVRNKKRIAEIAQAEKLGQTKLIPKINDRFSNETRLADLQLEEQLKGWSWAEDEKLKHQAEINKTQIALSTELDDIEKQLHKESIDDRLAYELQQYRKTQLQKQFDQINSYKSIQSQIKGLSGGAEDIFAKASMSPKDYATWSLKNNRDNAKLELKNQLVSTEQNIATSDSFSNEDERYKALLEAHKNYRDEMYALDVQYTQQSKDLIQAQKMDQLNMWGGILSTAQNTFSQLAQSAKDGLGEQSTTYRTMFAMQQAFSIASSMVAAWTAYTQAFADPSAMTLPQKFAGAASVMAALTPALATIGSIGFSSGGYTGSGGKFDVAGVVHKGEGVLNQEEIAALGGPSGFYALRSFIKNGFAEGGFVDGGIKVLNPQQGSDSGRYIYEARSNQNSQPSQVNVNPNIIITDDRKSISEFMASREGEQIILKTLKRNGYAR